MRQLLVAGIVYLIGISIILTIKPSFMFTEEGVWKEFGIGRNPRTHSWMPFWLFAILWALISYIITTILLCIFYPQTDDSNVSLKKQLKIIDEAYDVDTEELKPVIPKSRRKKGALEMADGYYILNREATEAAGGIPKYVYLGKGLPDVE
jgi:hypothetical protein